MITVKQRKFLDSLTDKEYREMFADELVGTSLAFQIRRLREARQLTQSDISGLTGKAQPTISQWEDPSYGRYTLSTLKELAAAFGLALLVRFVSFSELADWTVDVAPDRLTPPSYEDERQMSFDFSDTPEEPSPPAVSRPTVGISEASSSQVRPFHEIEPHTLSLLRRAAAFPGTITALHTNEEPIIDDKEREFAITA